MTILQCCDELLAPQEQLPSVTSSDDGEAGEVGKAPHDGCFVRHSSGERDD